MTTQTDSALEARSIINMQIARTALANDEFRRSLIADPKAEITKRLGQPLPDNLIVTVHEESPTHLHLVLPYKPDPSFALSDDELEAVAGGGWLPDPWFLLARSKNW